MFLLPLLQLGTWPLVTQCQALPTLGVAAVQRSTTGTARELPWDLQMLVCWLRAQGLVTLLAVDW
jgi:hypothetical protein